MPRGTMVPPRANHPVHVQFWIPSNDFSFWNWSVDYKAQRDFTAIELAAMADGQGVHCKYVPGTYLPLANKSNDYLMNRNAQKAGLTYSGIESIAIQDCAMQESMGPICDRRNEKLAPTDKGIMMARRKIFKAIKNLQKNGETPPGVDPAHHKIRSAAMLLPQDHDYEEGARNATKVLPGEAHKSV